MPLGTPRAPSCPTSKTLGGTGFSMISTAIPSTGKASLRDPHAQDIREAEARFMSGHEIERVMATRNRYPRKKAAPPKPDPITGEVDDTIPRRIAGFNLGFEKVFKTTSVTLPVMAHAIFVELHTAHDKQIFSRRFNGLNTVFDLKKWIFEKLLVPMDAYDLSYAEPGKAALKNELLLLTTEDSLDVRTLATTRAVHGMYRGEPGVHSVFDHSVTRLYMRLKCRSCGDLLNSLQSCRKFVSFGEIDVPAYASLKCPGDDPPVSRHTVLKLERGKEEDDLTFSKGIPGRDPGIEDCWYRLDEKKHCLFHTRGLELFEAARTHSEGAELARIYICNGKDPSKKLGLKEQIPLLKRAGKIAY